MKENQKIALIGSNVLLVPYRFYHVEKYHEWMKDEELQEATGSEPLTLSQEFEMQQKWANDEDKCTFIIVDKASYETCLAVNDPKGRSQVTVGFMAGDVNLFFNTSEAADDDSQIFGRTAELEVMIAEKSFRGKGLGKESAILMMLYGVKNLHVRRFTVKINSENSISLKMFRNLGFIDLSFSEIFKQFTLFFNINDEKLHKLENSATYEETPFFD